MSPNEQRIAIAEICGWKHYHLDLWVRPGVVVFSELDCEELPDYLNDLKAMNEAEKTLAEYPSQDGIYYITCLTKVCNADDRDKRIEVLKVATATAAQRAEAFLRSKGKWRAHDS